MELNLSEAVFRMFLALVLGSIVGVEREYSQQSAGLRTHILVCLGATVFTIVSIADMTHGMTHSTANSVGSALGISLVANPTRDPGRIAAQIVTGIGFIGGGAVLRHGASIRGLTTAASLWMMASIGMLVGTGYYQLSIVATLFSFLTLFIIGGLEHTMFRKHLKIYSRLRIQVTAKESGFPILDQWLEKTFPKKTVEVKTNWNNETHTATMTYIIDLKGIKADVHTLSKKLNTLEGVTSASIKVYNEEKTGD